MANVKELIKIREEKLKKMKENGINAYPERYETTCSIGESRNFEDGKENISVAGRVMSKRKMGKISFIDLSDISGHIQLCLKKDDLGEDEYKKIHEILDIGDFIGVKGNVFTTQAGEKTIQVYHFTFLGKSLRPLPEKFHGVSNQELIYRERHLDLIMNEETKNKFLLIYKFISIFRELFDNISISIN